MMHNQKEANPNKSDTIKRSRMWLLYPAAGIFVFLIACCMYLREGPFIHTMKMMVVPKQDNFQVEVLAPGKNVEVFSDKSKIKIAVESGGDGEKTRLSIEGGILDKGSRTPVTLTIVSDVDENGEAWEVQPVNGISAIRSPVTGMGNFIRYGYVILAGIVIVLMGIQTMRELHSKKQKEVLDYASKLLQRLHESEEGRELWGAGRACFLIYERRNIVNILCCNVLLLLLGLIAFWQIGHKPDLLSVIVDFVLGILAWLCLFYGLRIWWGKTLLRPIMDNRPLSAAAAYLMEGVYGMGSRQVRMETLHNAAVGLYRGGWFEEALCLLDLLWDTAGIKKSAYFSFIHCDLRQMCLSRLGRKAEAQREALKKEIILEEKTRFAKDKAVQLVLCSDGIRKKLETGLLEQAEEDAARYLMLCTTDYRRLPMLGLMAEIKAQLGQAEEADGLRQKILTFSPENWEVRAAMAYGPCACTCRLEKKTWRDPIGTVIRCGCVLVIAILCSSLLTIGIHTKTREGHGDVINETVESGLQTEEKPMDTEQSGVSEAESGMVRHAPEFTIEFPDSWQGLYVERELENGGIAIYQKSSYRLMGDGFLFAVTIFDNGDYINEPNYNVWGYDGSYVYVMTRPTDVTFYMEDDGVRQEYNRMEEQIGPIKDSFQILSDTASYDGEEFVFPNSSSVLLKDSDVWNLSAERLRIAKNEIYARHGRRFKDVNLQQYFGQCSWYEGTIDAEDFTDDLLNEIEWNNVVCLGE